MQRILSVENMRRSDEAACRGAVPSRELMARAGKGIFRSTPWRAPVAVVCGSGNNGGDGYVLSRLLHKAGLPVKLFLLKEKFSEDGAYYFSLCRAEGIETELCTEETDFSSFGSIADCLFGTGYNRTPEGLAKTVIEAINRSGAFVVSADINSGLNGDSGLGTVFVRSDLTVSIGSWKPGHFLGMAKDAMKAKLNLDIGIEPLEEPYRLWETEDVRRLLGTRKNFSNKGDYGYLALVGGSLRYSGAIRLANLSNCAMRAGAGVVKLAVPKSLCSAILPSILESTLFPLSEEDGSIRFEESEFRELIRGCRAAAFGMGVGSGSETEKALRFLLSEYTGTLLLDADGLNALARIGPEALRTAACRCVLTPHLKEFSRLCGKSIEEINASPIPLARQFAKENGAILLLKGPSTVVTDGERVWITSTGCPGMATAGSGDVLSGIVTALCAAHPGELAEAAASAAFLNGLAGEIAEEKNGAISMIASDTAACLRDAVLRVTRAAEE